MADNLIQYCDLSNKTNRTVTYTWTNLQCTVSGTATGGFARDDILRDNIANTHFVVNHTYQIYYSASVVQLRFFFYTTDTFDTVISSFSTLTDRQFTIPAGTVGIIIQLRVPSGSTANETVEPEVYDITFTDRDADIQIMSDLIQYGPYPNSWFLSIWNNFGGYLGWDGESCSEIACCVSYMAGNISKIYVSNYADGLYQQYLAAGRYYTPVQGAQLGDFMWWDYDNDGVPDHTGRVYDILSDGTIITFEGNVGGMTTSRPYSPYDSTIFGYGRPNYDYDPAVDPDQPGAGFQPHNFFRHTRRLRGNLL